MIKTKIKNALGQEIVVVVDQPDNPQGLAFVMHGLGGFKEQPHIETFAKSFKDSGYTAVRFDTTNTFGESDGDYENATVTNYYNDLEAVINWAKTQSWYQEPFCLCGHSLGGICAALFAEKYPDKVKALAPISTVVSGELSTQTPSHQAEDAEWRRTGYSIKESASKPGLMKRLKWSHMEDRLKYDLMPNVSKLLMPVLLIVGEIDGSTPPSHQKVLFDALPGKKELHIIKGALHTFRAPEHLEEIYNIMTTWIKNL